MGFSTFSKGVQGTVTLAAGTAHVTNAAVTAGTVVFLTVQALGTVTAPKPVAVTAVTAGAFTITSADDTDTSVIAYAFGEG